MNKYNIEKMLPHDAPMVLIDNIVEINQEEKYVITSVKIKENSIFYFWEQDYLRII